MAFEVLLQTNTSERIKVDKALSTVATVSGTMRDDSSITDPVFLLDTTLETMANVNYLTVAAFGRSYFLGSPVLITNKLIEVSGHVDVLSSFKTTLRQQTAIIKRQKDLYNLMLNDGSIHAYQNPHVITKYFPNSLTTYSYVLIVAGVAYSAGIVITQQPQDFYAEEPGAAGSFTVIATGESLTYQWQKAPLSGFQIWQNIANANSNVYTFTATQEAEEWRYRCRIQNMYGAQVYTNEVQIYEL